MNPLKTETIDWNEASKRGLIVRINSEILHPLGLAMCRNVEDGTSPHLLVSDDGVWVYAETDQMVSVPREPTQEMVEALKAELMVTSRGGILRAGIALTKAIAAAPPATSNQGEIVTQWSDDGLIWSDGEEHEMASARAEGYRTRTLYLHPAERPDIGTNSDKYKAELYDEVWTKATSMGFMNVTMALEKLAELPAPVAIDETAEFLKAWPEISKHGVDNGWRGVASAAWKARSALSGGKHAG